MRHRGEVRMTIRLALLFAVLAGCRSWRRADRNGYELLTPITGPLATDSAVLARLASTHPCRPELPPVRLDVDSLPTAVRCTLLTTAFAAIEARNGAPEVFAGLREFKAADVRCALVRAEAYRNERTGELELPHWTVELLSERQPSLAVQISRLTGDARAFRVLEEFGFTAAQLCARAP
jgi:hypothetical protein